MSYKKSLFIFRRDLRLHDNKGLNEALRSSEKVVPCFIFDPRQITEKNKYRSENALQFMFESIEDLRQQLKKHGARLYTFFGKADEVVEKLIAQEKINAVYVCRDYTPFSLHRDEALHKKAVHYGVDFYQINDALLHEPEEVATNNGEPYSVFTPFYKRSRQLPVTLSEKLVGDNFYKQPIAGHKKYTVYDCIESKNEQCTILGGTVQAEKILKNIHTFKNYTQEHDFPAIATTHLSAHNKFGTVSIRQVYHTIKKVLGINHPLLRQLYWRDFFYSAAYFSPFVFGQPFRAKYANIAWSQNTKLFKRWCQGSTGFPLVDAGMRELNATGFMHNRLRLIVGSFLVKDLHIDWQWGERYFAQNLVDYDPCVNNGNWQWVASTGSDSQPYFRVFNPWLQQKKFDNQCIYIKRWIPELKNVPQSVIHTWFKQKTKINGYPLPMVDHGIESKKSKLLYTQIC